MRKESYATGPIAQASDGSSQIAFRILGVKVFSKCDTKIKKCLREDVLYLLCDDYEEFYCDVHRLRYEGGISVASLLFLPLAWFSVLHTLNRWLTLKICWLQSLVSYRAL